MGLEEDAVDLLAPRATNVDGSFTITEAIKNGTLDSLYVNGTLVLSQGGKLATLAGGRDKGNLARGYDDNTYFTGDIAEVLVYDRALSASERQAVEQHLAGKYALSVAGPLALADAVGVIHPTLQLQVRANAEGLLQLLVSGAPGITCTLEQSTNLRDWTPLKTLTLPADGTSSLTVKVRAGTDASYFRARFK